MSGRRRWNTSVWIAALTVVVLLGLGSSPAAPVAASGETPTPTPTAMDGMGGMVMTTPTPTMDTMGGMDMGATMTATPSMGGMDMGHDMSPVDPVGAAEAPMDARGGQPLASEMVDGVRVFKLSVEKVRWHILKDVEVVAYSYNGTVPGPEIRVTEGERIRILVTNKLDEGTSVHWHGLLVPNDQDGAAGITQPPINPGETYTYEWTVPNTPGTYFYHSHMNADRQQTLGLYGPLIIEPKVQTEKYDVEYTVMLGEWMVKGGMTYPSMDMEGMMPNYFTINGHSYPSTDTIKLKVGQRVLIRFIGSGQFIHPMHLHGQPFKIIAEDGYPVPEAVQITKDTVLIGPGERYDVEFTARAPGKWLLHCHINHHMTNNGQEVDGAGGLTMIFDVSAN